MATNTTYANVPMRGRLRRSAAHVRRVLVPFLELQIPMALGALVCSLVLGLVLPSSSFATAYHPGTYLFTIGDLLFLTVPVMAWMLVRGHGWRSSLEMAGAMLMPVAAIIVLGQAAGSNALLWLPTAGYLALSLGMLAYLLARRTHVVGRQRQSTPAADPPVNTHALEQ
jgi:hypothetical protein